MKKYIIPYADILCYCLMPNHFHWLILPNTEACEFVGANKSSQRKKQNLSHAIGTLLSSYSKAINAQQDWGGSLFKTHTKAKNGIVDGFITVSGKNKDLFFASENNYAQICFEYIHQNPVKSGLVESPIDWPYSSAIEYAGLSYNPISNILLGEKLLLRGN